MRIAMWSGPRNLSTAMMYSFASRSDCAVWDEPFYAAYLAATGLDHPMRSEILAAGHRNAEDVIQRCTGSIPNGKSIYYQKHMSQHMLGQFDRNWIFECQNVFLIRDPARVIASYAAKRENPTADDLGFRQQGELFDMICQKTGTSPPVLDSFDIRLDPEKALRKLCASIGLGFDPRMLTWPKGSHRDDGVWAPHWYAAVWNSTGFAAPEGEAPEIADHLKGVYAELLPHYEKMASFKL